MPDKKHSRAYHRYFEDYAERQTMDESGRLAIERVYVGRYYRVNLSGRALRRQKVLFLLLYLGAAALFLLSGVTLQVSAVGLAAIATMAALLSLLWLAVPVFHRLTAPREMEVRTWRESSASLRHAGAGAAVCLFACAGASLAAAFLVPGYSRLETALGVLPYVLSGAFSLGIHILERRTDYEVLPPKNQRPEGSSPIRYYTPD